MWLEPTKIRIWTHQIWFKKWEIVSESPDQTRSKAWCNAVDFGLYRSLVPITLRSAYIRAYADISIWLLAYSASGAALELLLGVGQAWVLRRMGFKTRGWIPTTAAAYGLGFPCGLIVSLLISILSWRLVRGENLLPLTASATYASSSIWPYMNALIISGSIVGIT